MFTLSTWLGHDGHVPTKDLDSAAPSVPLPERLVAAATRLLIDGGPDAITLRAVAAAVGVSHMAPYRHFDDKESLLAAVAERGFDRMADAMAVAAHDDTDALQRLRVFGVSYTRFAMHNPQLYRFMFGPQVADTARHPGLERAGARAYGYCADTVAAVLDQRGERDPAVVHAHAVATWSIVHGLSLLLLDDRVAATHDDGDGGRLIARVLTLFGRVFR